MRWAGGEGLEGGKGARVCPPSSEREHDFRRYLNGMGNYAVLTWGVSLAPLRRFFGHVPVVTCTHVPVDANEKA